MIDEEAFHPLSGGAVYTFRSKRRELGDSSNGDR
jgi:hypothetical protein